MRNHFNGQGMTLFYRVSLVRAQWFLPPLEVVINGPLHNQNSKRIAMLEQMTVLKVAHVSVL